MKKTIFLFCAALLVLGCCLPLAGYYITRAVLGPAAPQPADSGAVSAPEPGGLGGLFSDQAEAAPAEEVLLRDAASGLDFTLTLREYLIGAVSSEMPVSWPDEALKAQAVACHSYILYCRDHRENESDPWLSVDPARRQGCMTDAVLRSYWGTAYEQNYARMSALIDQVLEQVLYYDGAPAGASYFAISNGRTESSENVWGTALPYLSPVDSSTDRQADNYEVTVTFSADQIKAALANNLGIAVGENTPESWFGAASYTDSGYVASQTVCGQAVSGTVLRSALGLRSACFSIVWQGDGFSITTLGYGHGVGLSQWGAKALAEQGAGYEEILAHYFPGTTLSP